MERDLSREIAACRVREAEVDAAGMRARIASFPDQLAEGVDRALPFALELGSRLKPTVIAVAGMGGSAIAADLVAAVSRDERTVPLVVLRGYDLPAWIGDGAWLVASSYSGNTEETLAMWEAATDRGIETLAITTGGRLGKRAREVGQPVLELPSGSPPRAALGWSLPAVGLVAAALDPGLDPERMAERLRAAGRTLAREEEGWLAWDGANPALPIAASAANGIAIVYGGHPISIAAARRWKTQLNENGKVPAWWGAFPEHNHNEIVGFEGDGPALGELVLVYLETPWDHPRVRRRFASVSSGETGVAAEHRVTSAGDDPMTGMLWLCWLGDCASFLVSVITGKDPTPVTSIDRLKTELDR